MENVPLFEDHENRVVIDTSLLKDKKNLIIAGLCILCGVSLYFVSHYKSNSSTSIYVETGENDEDVVVDVSGAVSHPGIYKLPGGSVFADALHLAGGVVETSNIEWVSKNLNLATKLSDSQKIYIPFEWDTDGYELTQIAVFESKVDSTTATNFSESTNASPVEEGSGINMNTAALEELKALSGVGDVYAKRIIENRPYVGVEELKSKAEINQGTIDKIKDQISF